eukprot:2572106-Rhodomonas_salina.1
MWKRDGLGETKSQIIVTGSCSAGHDGIRCLPKKRECYRSAVGLLMRKGGDECRLMKRGPHQEGLPDPVMMGLVTGTTWERAAL